MVESVHTAIPREGLSPRVRGNRWSSPFRSSQEVYPRVCGGTRTWPADRRVYPRVCGGTPHVIQVSVQRRSIPACAGEPCHRSHRTYRRWGLSPRVRGNPKRDVADRRQGSIPACAGEPDRCRSSRRRRSIPACAGGLSPRVRGIPACAGEHQNDDRCKSETGLSPRVRGNHHGPLSLNAGGCRVYPRVCGGTIGSGRGGTCRSTGLSPRVRGNQSGLSPRVRGNPRLHNSTAEITRSIPACAGETGFPVLMPGKGLSPRVRGNQESSQCHCRAAKGLSPRVRGNPCHDARRAHCEVYPRVCGGTCLIWPQWDLSQGLSPRVRGKPVPGYGVYPRVCGGTLTAPRFS